MPEEEVVDFDELFGEDEKAIEQGIWVVHSLGPKFLVCAATDSNPRYTRSREKVMKPYRRAMELGMLGEKKASEALAKVYSQVIIVNWEHVVINGEEVPYSQKACYSLLLKYPKLFRWIRSEATDNDLFALVTQEEEEN